jgi:glyoxylase-like metal-dependent hydrolase (beta-lactamase superfamily II)/rhodanese-related sulfurtransferase
MFFRQYQLACLSLFSYLIGDETTGRAVVVDPQRDVSQYLADADEHGLRIERIFETHFHADFLSGHLELAAVTGAPITYGDGARADFPIEPFTDGQRLGLGEVIVEVRATPGHTPESISLVVYEHPDAEPWGVLTGDTLFIGDVGRPDLLASAGWSPDQLARRLCRSIHDQLLTLPDSTRVFPAHGAGSACGKTMAAAAESTIGEQRATNYALRRMSENAFVEAVTQGQSVAPLYFVFAANANRQHHELLDDDAPPPELQLAGLEEWAGRGAVVIDARPLEVFASGHFRGSVNISLDGRFAEYAGVVARPGQPIVVVTDPGRQTEAKVRLARIGFDAVVGAVWTIDEILTERPDLAEQSNRLTPVDLAAWRADAPHLQLVDVRNRAEQATGIIEGAASIPLAVLLDRLEELNQTAPTIVYCTGGYRSAVAASLLRAHGFARVADIIGGYDAWRDAGLPTVAPDGLTMVP